jgi:hypothetical protein
MNLGVKGSFTLEYALFVGAAIAIAAIALPTLFAYLGGYLEGFHD